MPSGLSGECCYRTCPDPTTPRNGSPPFAGYFTDPFIVPVARTFRVPPRLVALLLLALVAALSVALGRLPSLFE